MTRSVPCPTCGARASYGPDNPWRPFCCQRCRSIDLGAWASERFRVPVQNPPQDADDPALRTEPTDDSGRRDDDSATVHH